MSFPYPYLAILESCAFSFRFDDLKVWDFKQFITELLRFADGHAHISFNKKIDLKNVKKDGRHGKVFVCCIIIFLKRMPIYLLLVLEV